MSLYSLSQGLSKRVAAALLLFFFMVQSCFGNGESSLLSRPNEKTFLPGPLKLTQDLGHLEWVSRNNQKKPVDFILIEDAHAVTDAQHKISSILNQLVRDKIISSIALEGSSGRLDPVFLKTFPLPDLRDRVLEEYLGRGELSGGEYAAVQNGGQVEVRGIENPRLYQQNHQVMREVLKNREEVLGKLSRLRRRWEGEMRQALTPDQRSILNAIDEVLSGSLDIKQITFLLGLPDVKKAAPDVRHWANLTRSVNSQEQHETVAKIKKGFAQRVLPKTAAGEKVRWGGLLQGWETGSLSDCEFLASMIEMGEAHGIHFKNPEKFKSFIEQARWINGLKQRDGKLFESFEVYLRRVEEKNFQGNARPWMLRRRGLRLARKFIQLELSLQEWRRHPALWRSLSQKPEFTAAKHFYELVSERDRAFAAAFHGLAQKHISTAVVLGGFHRDAFSNFCRHEKLNCAVVTPAIRDLAGHEFYEPVMQGKVSYQSKGTGEYEAFMSHAALRLNAGIPENMHGIIYSEWRKNLLFALAETNRLGDAERYAPFLEEFKSGKKRTASENWQGWVDQKVEELWAGFKKNWNLKLPALRQMEREGKLTPASTADLLASGRNMLAFSTAKLIPESPPLVDPGRQEFPLETGVPSAPPRSEIRIPQLLDLKGPVFAQTEDIDALDIGLMRAAANAGQKYLRISINDLRDLSLLETEAYLENGEVKTRAGILYDLIEHGGILLLDYAGSDPQFVEDFSSLFNEKNPFYLSSEHPAHPGLKIIGAARPDQFLKYPNTVYSRFESSMTGNVQPEEKAGESADPVGEWNETSLENAEVVDLSGHPMFAEEMIGTYQFGGDGRLQAAEGALIRALASGKPIVVRGVEWEPKLMRNPQTGVVDKVLSSPIAHFLRKLAVDREFKWNGKTYRLKPGAFIFRAERNFKEGVKDKVVHAGGEAPPESAFVMNLQTADMLHSRFEIETSGRRMLGRKGLLQDPAFQEKGLDLYITETQRSNFPDYYWHMIMHAPFPVRIWLAPGVPVPRIYKDFVQGQPKIREKVVPAEYDAALGSEKAVVIESEDISLTLAKVEQATGRKPVIFSTSPGARLNDLMGEMSVEKKDGAYEFELQSTEWIEALENGETVVVTGLDQNPQLARQLESWFSSQAYVERNGKRIPLTDFSGKIVAVVKSNPLLTARQTAKITPKADNYAEILIREAEQAGGQPVSKERADEIRSRVLKIFELVKIFQSIPVPNKPRLYPEQVEMGLARLRLMLTFDNLAEAFQQGIINRYENAPDVAAFMRVMVRKSLGVEFPGRNPKAVHEDVLTSALNLTAYRSWDQVYWRLLDSLGSELIRRFKIFEDFDKHTTGDIFRIIRAAMAKANSKDPEIRDFFKKYSDSETVELTDSEVDQAPVLEKGPDTLTQDEEKILEYALRFRGLFFKGVPGSGKSYLAKRLRALLSEKMFDGDRKRLKLFGPVTVGQDVKEQDVLARTVMKKGKTVLEPGTIAEWVFSEDGGLLAVDEANLADPEFWEFLRGAFDPLKPHVWIAGVKHKLSSNHKIIFTGNDETVAGRRFISLIQEHMLTIPFRSMPDSFFSKLLLQGDTQNEVAPYLDTDLSSRDNLSEMLIETYRMLESIEPEGSYSLRNLQEMAIRMNVFLPRDWDPGNPEHLQQAVWRMWQLEQGVLSPEARAAFSTHLEIRWGIRVDDVEQKEIKDALQRYQREYSWEGFTHVASSVKLGLELEAFAKIYKHRLEGGKLDAEILGKLGMIISGPSGRGKDDLLARLLPILMPGVKIHFLNANFRDLEGMIKIIGQAKENGEVVVLSEMNRLPSGFLEGRLNDVLTGDAHPGFAFFATINPESFAGRQTLSSALLNRVIFENIEDYPQQELQQIADSLYPEASAANRKLLVNLHAWIRQQAPGVDRFPTMREFKRALKRLAEGMSFEQAAEEVYGNTHLRPMNQKMPDQSFLKNFKEESQRDIVTEIEKTVNALVPSAEQPVRLAWINSASAAGKWNASRRILELNKATTAGDWKGTVYHETSHGVFTRDDKLRPWVSFENEFYETVFQDMEDLRHGYAFDRDYPHARVGVLADEEKQLINMILAGEKGDFVKMRKWLMDTERPLTDRALFQLLLIAWGKRDQLPPEARGRFTEERIQVFAAAINGTYPADRNPAALALKHLARVDKIREAIPESKDEMKVLYQQYKALKLMQEMEKDFRLLPEKKKDKANPLRASEIVSEKEAVENLQGPAAPELRQPPEIAAPEDLQEKALAGLPGAREKQDREFKLAGIEHLVEGGRLTLEKLTEQIVMFLKLSFRLIFSRNTDEHLRARALLKKLVVRLLEAELWGGFLLKWLWYNKWIRRGILMALGAGLLWIGFEAIHYFSNGFSVPAGGIPEKMAPGRGIRLPGAGFFQRLLDSMTDIWFWVYMAFAVLVVSVLSKFSRVEETGGRHLGEDKTAEGGPSLEPVLARPEKPRVVPAARRPEGARRQQRWRQISEMHADELNNALLGLVKPVFEVKKDFGTTGTPYFSVFPFDQVNYYFSPRPAMIQNENDFPELILAADPAQALGDPMMEEIFFFLFSQGYRVSVYTGNFESVTTVASLKEAALRIRPEEEAQTALKTAAKPNAKVIHPLDLKEILEPVYFSAAAAKVMSGEKDEGPEELNTDEKTKLLNEVEKVLTRFPGEMAVDLFQGNLTLKVTANFRRETVEALAKISGLQFDTLNFDGGNISDLEPLAGKVEILNLYVKKIKPSNPSWELTGANKFFAALPRLTFVDVRAANEILDKADLSGLKSLLINSSRTQPESLKINRLPPNLEYFEYQGKVEEKDFEQFYELLSRHPHKENLTIMVWKNGKQEPLTWNNAPEKFKGVQATAVLPLAERKAALIKIVLEYNAARSEFERARFYDRPGTGGMELILSPSPGLPDLMEAIARVNGLTIDILELNHFTEMPDLGPLAGRVGELILFTSVSEGKMEFKIDETTPVEFFSNLTGLMADPERVNLLMKHSALEGLQSLSLDFFAKRHNLADFRLPPNVTEVFLSGPYPKTVDLEPLYKEWAKRPHPENLKVVFGTKYNQEQPISWADVPEKFKHAQPEPQGQARRPPGEFLTAQEGFVAIRPLLLKNFSTFKARITGEKLELEMDDSNENIPESLIQDLAAIRGLPIDTLEYRRRTERETQQMPSLFPLAGKVGAFKLWGKNLFSQEVFNMNREFFSSVVGLTTDVPRNAEQFLVQMRRVSRLQKFHFLGTPHDVDELLIGVSSYWLEFKFPDFLNNIKITVVSDLNYKASQFNLNYLYDLWAKHKEKENLTVSLYLEDEELKTFTWDDAREYKNKDHPSEERLTPQKGLEVISKIIEKYNLNSVEAKVLHDGRLYVQLSGNAIPIPFIRELGAVKGLVIDHLRYEYMNSLMDFSPLTGKVIALALDFSSSYSYFSIDKTFDLNLDFFASLTKLSTNLSAATDFLTGMFFPNLKKLEIDTMNLKELPHAFKFPEGLEELILRRKEIDLVPIYRGWAQLPHPKNFKVTFEVFGDLDNPIILTWDQVPKQYKKNMSAEQKPELPEVNERGHQWLQDIFVGLAHPNQALEYAKARFESEGIERLQKFEALLEKIIGKKTEELLKSGGETEPFLRSETRFAPMKIVDLYNLAKKRRSELRQALLALPNQISGQGRPNADDVRSRLGDWGDFIPMGPLMNALEQDISVKKSPSVQSPALSKEQLTKAIQFLRRKDSVWKQAGFASLKDRSSLLATNAFLDILGSAESAEWTAELRNFFPDGVWIGASKREHIKLQEKLGLIDARSQTAGWLKAAMVSSNGKLDLHDSRARPLLWFSEGIQPGPRISRSLAKTGFSADADALAELRGLYLQKKITAAEIIHLLLLFSLPGPLNRLMEQPREALARLTQKELHRGFSLLADLETQMQALEKAKVSA